MTEIRSFFEQNLLEMNLITPEQLMEAKEEQQRTGMLLGHILVDMDFVKEEDVMRVLGRQLGMEVVQLKELDLNPDVVHKITSSTAKLYSVIPVGIEEGSLVVAMADPLNPNILDDLRFLLDMEIKGAISNDKDIEEAIKKYFGDEEESITDLLSEIEDQMSTELIDLDDSTVDIASLRDMANEAPVVKLLNLVLIQAVKDRASDIHFEPFENEYKIRCRIDGALYEMVPPPKQLALPVTSRIKVMADMDIAERRLPQDGRIQVSISGKNIDLRVSTLPTQFGESVVMRVLDKTVVSLDVGKIGLRQDHIDILGKIIHKPNGIILVTGPTGSGKTTTLYACLRALNSIEEKLLTAEDPIEYELEGIVQVAVNSSIGLTFAAALRSFLRQDPDRIMVGEIRDLETAQISVQASLTGHLVLSTVHTNDAAGCITRLIDMGLEPFLIASTLEVAIGQRLVRTICKHCKTEYDPTAEDVTNLGLKPQDLEGQKFYYGVGCDECNKTGYRGRQGIFEFFVVNDRIRQLIIEQAPTSELKRAAREMGMRSMREDGLMKIFDGITTIEEVVRET